MLFYVGLWGSHDLGATTAIAIRFIPAVSASVLFDLTQIGVWTRTASQLPLLVPVGPGLHSDCDQSTILMESN